jgi:3-hydroxyisobutyrate dehydrogenase
MPPSLKIALLGTGLLGKAIAERLTAVGHRVVVFNRTRTKALPLEAQGIAVVGSAEVAVTQADLVLLLLTDAPAIHSVLFSPACSAALSGKTIVQMGTIDSNESLEIEREVKRRRGTYCEAPVLGSLAEAKAGTLLVMVGGTEDQFAALAPLFRSLGREPRFVGAVGKAAALKLALNQLIAAETLAFGLSLGLIRRAGISVDTFMTILRESALYAPTFGKKLPRLLKRDYHHPNFSTRHLLKDVRLFVREAGARGVTTRPLEGMASLLEAAIAQGLGEADYSALYDLLDPPPSGSPPSPHNG